MKTARRDAGVSLLELVAVMAIFSLLALLALQLLTQAITNRDMIAASDARISALSSTLALLRRDLEHAAPQPLDDGDAPYLDIFPDGLRLATFTSGPDPTIAKVTWRFDPTGNTLERQMGDRNGMVLLEDVSDIQVQYFGPSGWMAGTNWRAIGPADLPRGLQIILTLPDFGEVKVVIAR
jgi:general secretion pathway protein J